ncbi:MAG: hypothetical protein AAF970_05225 [Bacteroidota bacterium]
MIEHILNLDPSVRYVAILKHGHLETQQKAAAQEASSAESDRYEELLVNPTLLTLATQRGNIDCGGLDYLVIRYGHFFQFVVPQPWGHVSVCIEATADPLAIGHRIRSLLAAWDEAEPDPS